jgi:hypothetical protein
MNSDNGRDVLDLQLLLVSACRTLSKSRLNVFPHPNGHGGRVLGLFTWFLRLVVSFFRASDVVVIGGCGISLVFLHS